MLRPEAWTARVYVPGDVVDCVVIERALVPSGATGFGVKLAFAPNGNPDTDSVIGEAKPFTGDAENE